MIRRDVERAELDAMLTEQLRAVEDLEDATLRVAYVWEQPDRDGCNWSPDVMLNLGAKGCAAYAAPFVERIVRAARALYNVKR